MALWGAVAGVAIVAWLLPLSGEVGTRVTAAHIAASLGFVVCGVLADRRGSRRVGAVMVVLGVLLFAQDALREQLVPWRYTVGIAADHLQWAPLLWLALAFPSGRLDRVDRVLVGAMVLVTYGSKPFELAWRAPSADCLSCAPAGNVLFVTPPPFDMLSALELRLDLMIWIGAAVVASLVVRWLRAAAPERRVLAPVLVPVVAYVAKLVADDLFLLDRGAVQLRSALDVATIPNALLACAIPAGVLIGAARDELARSPAGALLSGIAEGSDLRGRLARALGDRSLEIAYWSSELGRHVDADGRDVVLPGAGHPRRAATRVDDGDRPLAVLIHDAALLEDRGLVATVAAAARIGLVNERLTADIRAQIEEVRASRARLVATAEAERRRLERAVADGPLRRLGDLGDALERVRAARPDAAADAEVALAEVARAAEELTELGSGVLPAPLTEGGLAAALATLEGPGAVTVVVDAAPAQRLPAAVEAAAWFVCSEAVANAAKHAGARVVRVRAATEPDGLRVDVSDDGRGGAVVDAGGGLDGLRARVERLGGTLAVGDRRGGGTTVAAWLPAAGGALPAAA